MPSSEHRLKSKLDIDSLIAFIREHQCISRQRLISESTLLERELGITGDDGCELLEAIENKFKISFRNHHGSLSKAFGLSEGQYLFHSEGFDLFRLIGSIFGKDFENVKAITVGDLYRVVSEARHTALDRTQNTLSDRSNAP